jgi:hypothetical protein
MAKYFFQILIAYYTCPLKLKSTIWLHCHCQYQNNFITGSRNLIGTNTLPTIWGTYMKLVTKYQISAINSCWKKCDEKCAYMFNVYINQLSRQTGSRNLTGQKMLPTIWTFLTHRKSTYFYTPGPRRGRGYTVLPLSVCPSFRPSKIFFVAFFFSNCWWQKSDIWSQASYRYTIMWVAVQKRFPQYGIPIWSLWPNIRFLSSIVA